MIDIFMEALLGALVRFGTIVTIEPGFGAVAFCSVVILTIFAAEAFDSRLMRDAVERGQLVRPPFGGAQPASPVSRPDWFDDRQRPPIWPSFFRAPFRRSRNSRPTFTIGVPAYSTTSAVA